MGLESSSSGRSTVSDDAAFASGFPPISPPKTAYHAVQRVGLGSEQNRGRSRGYGHTVTRSTMLSPPF